MKVAWLADDPGYTGGAELTQAEFKAAAPPGVEIVTVAPDQLSRIESCDVCVLHNITIYPAETASYFENRRIAKYLHDLWPHGDPTLREAILTSGSALIFCSPLQRRHFPHPLVARESLLIPPAINLDLFRRHAPTPVEVTSYGEEGPRWIEPNRENACWLGSMNFWGAGVTEACEWAEREQTKTYFYGAGPYAPSDSEWVEYRGAVRPQDVPLTLGRYKQMVFLPTAVEPFGRAVAEAWAAGCELIVNENVGALHWIREAPEKLDSAAEDFWAAVLR